MEPVFLGITLLVNGCVLLGAAGFYWLEQDSNAQMASFLDALYWSVSTVTTVGYGDIVAGSTAGKLISIALMMLGTVASVSYTALFVSALVSPELEDVEQRVSKVDLDVRDIESQFRREGNEIESLTKSVRTLSTQLNELRNSGFPAKSDKA